MKVTYKSKDGRFVVEFEANTQQEVWDELAGFQEIFENNTCKAKFQGKIVESDMVRFAVRENSNGDRFYEKVCEDWDKGLFGFKKSFSLRKNQKGTLYPHKMPEENRVPALDNWYKYLPNEKKEETNETKEDNKESTAATLF